MDLTIFIIILIIPIIISGFISFFLKNQSQIGKIAPFSIILLLLINLSLILSISFNFFGDNFTTNNSMFFIYSLPNIGVILLSIFLILQNRIKYLFRVISYYSLSMTVGGVLSLLITNYKSTDMALSIVIEIFFMPIFYWLSFAMYKKVNPHAKIATQFEFPAEKLISYHIKNIEHKLFGKTPNIQDSRYTALKENNEIEVINQKTALKRIIKYLLASCALTVYYCLIFKFI